MKQSRRLSLTRDVLAELTPAELDAVGGGNGPASTFTTVIITRRVPTWWACPVAGPSLPVAYCDAAN